MSELAAALLAIEVWIYRGTHPALWNQVKDNVWTRIRNYSFTVADYNDLGESLYLAGVNHARWMERIEWYFVYLLNHYGPA